MFIGATASSCHSKALFTRNAAPKPNVVKRAAKSPVLEAFLAAVNAITAVKLLVRRINVFVAPLLTLKVSNGGHAPTRAFTLTNMYAPRRTPKNIISEARKAQTPSLNRGTLSKNPPSVSSSSRTTNLSVPYPYSPTHPTTTPGITRRKLGGGGTAVSPRKNRKADKAITIGHLLR